MYKILKLIPMLDIKFVFFVSIKFIIFGMNMEIVFMDLVTCFSKQTNKKKVCIKFFKCFFLFRFFWVTGNTFHFGWNEIISIFFFLLLGFLLHTCSWCFLFFVLFGRIIIITPVLTNYFKFVLLLLYVAVVDVGYFNE